MTAERRGEKIGWTAGWIGGFIWVAALSLVFVYQNKFGQGVVGMLVTVAALITIFFFAPWKHPSTPYWKLMAAPYGVFLLAIGWAVWSYGGLEHLGLNWWNFLWIIPALSPFGFLSHRKWAESDDRHADEPEANSCVRDRRH